MILHAGHIIERRQCMLLRAVSFYSQTALLQTLNPNPEPPRRTDAKESLRRQVGTLRFDLNTLATAKVGKADKKKALDLRKKFLTSVESLDFAIRSKDKEDALKKLTVARVRCPLVTLTKNSCTMREKWVALL